MFTTPTNNLREKTTTLKPNQLHLILRSNLLPLWLQIKLNLLQLSQRKNPQRIPLLLPKNQIRKRNPSNKRSPRQSWLNPIRLKRRKSEIFKKSIEALI
jgi:hypothetical protein